MSSAEGVLPVLAQAKERVRALQCLNNLRQWAQAFYFYGDDSDYIPREGHRRDGAVRVDNWAHVYISGNTCVLKVLFASQDESMAFADLMMSFHAEFEGRSEQ